MTRPSAPAVITAGFLGLDAAIMYAAGAPWAALILAAAAVVALAVFWHVPLRDDMLALIEATRECRCCSPEDYGACTCTAPCKSIRCTAGFDDMPPAPPRFPDWDIRELTGK